MARKSKSTPLNKLFPEHIIPKGHSVFRVIRSTYDPRRYSDDSFNSHPWRFTPFDDIFAHLSSRDSGKVSGLYCGDSIATCLYETVFRKGADDSGPIPLEQVSEREGLELRFNRDMLLVQLTDSGLQTLLGHNPILDINSYEHCHAVATRIYHRYQSKSGAPVDGLLFPSFQSKGVGNNYCLFSRRTTAKDLSVVRNTRHGLSSDKYRFQTAMVADASKMRLTRALQKALMKMRR